MCSKVLLILGLGSGKSTISKAVAQKLPSFQRISIDGIIASRHGIYGVDYPKPDYDKHQEEADTIFQQFVEEILAGGSEDLILDRSFYAKADRDFFKKLIEKQGGRWVLVYLKAPKAVLWQRICARREASVNADSALEISKELLSSFFDGFEVPGGEGEIVVETSA